jgi:hypothetical protein
LYQLSGAHRRTILIDVCQGRKLKKKKRRNKSTFKQTDLVGYLIIFKLAQVVWSLGSLTFTQIFKKFASYYGTLNSSSCPQEFLSASRIQLASSHPVSLKALYNMLQIFKGTSNYRTELGIPFAVCRLSAKLMQTFRGKRGLYGQRGRSLRL